MHRRYNNVSSYGRQKSRFSYIRKCPIKFLRIYRTIHFPNSKISLRNSPIMSFYNPENPYVFNENYYQNTTHVIYKETTFYYIFRTSFVLSFLLSLLFIGLIVFLVIFKTSKSFKPYSKMLFIVAITDFILALGEFLVQSVSSYLKIDNIKLSI